MFATLAKAEVIVNEIHYKNSTDTIKNVKN
jgi:hypothetical protein